MDTEETAKTTNLRPVTKIIASYVGNHALALDQLSALIRPGVVTGGLAPQGPRRPEFTLCHGGPTAA